MVVYLFLLLILIVSIDAKRRKVQVAYPVGNVLTNLQIYIDYYHTAILLFRVVASCEWHIL